MAVAARLLLIGALLYLVIVAALYAFQSRFIYPAPQDEPPLTPFYAEVTLETADGLSLRAFHSTPALGVPTVLYFHGNGGTLAGASRSNSVFQNDGGVLLVEYRGYGGNPGKPSEEGFYRDADAALRWLKDEGISPADTVVIGNSIGSGVATYAAEKLVGEGTPPLGLILIAPFTSMPDVASEKLWWLPVRPLIEGDFPNQERIEKLKGVPILIQHGTKDNVIPDTHGRALANSSNWAELMSYEGSGHGLSFEERSQVDRAQWIFERMRARREIAQPSSGEP